MRNPVVEAANFARMGQGLPPAPPGDVILPTRAVDPTGRAIPDSAPYVDAEGGAYPAITPAGRGGFSELTDEQYEQMYEREDPPRRDEEQELLTHRTAENWPTFFPPPEPVKQAAAIDSFIKLDEGRAHWAGHDIHLTADEIAAIKGILKDGIVRQLEAERERIQAMSGLFSTSSKRTKKVRKASGKKGRTTERCEETITR